MSDNAMAVDAVFRSHKIEEMGYDTVSRRYWSRHRMSDGNLDTTTGTTVGMMLDSIAAKKGNGK